MDIVPRYRPIKFKRKKVNQTWENGKNLFWGHILAHLAHIWFPNLFSWGLLLLDIRHRHKLSFHAITWKTYDPTTIKLPKSLFWVWFRPVGPKFGPPNFFKNLASPVTRYHGQHGQLSSCSLSEKTNNPILRKLWLKDGRTNRQMDKSDFYRTLPH